MFDVHCSSFPVLCSLLFAKLITKNAELRTDHKKLLSMLSIHVKDNNIIRLVRQYLERTVEKYGAYIDVKKGISMGSPLSSLIGAFYLREMDEELAREGVYST